MSDLIRRIIDQYREPPIGAREATSTQKEEPARLWSRKELEDQRRASIEALVAHHGATSTQKEEPK